MFKKEKQGTSLSQRKAIRQTTGGTSTLSVCLWARQREREQEENFLGTDGYTEAAPMRRRRRNLQNEAFGGRKETAIGVMVLCVCVMMGGGGHSKNLDPGVFGFFIET